MFLLDPAAYSAFMFGRRVPANVVFLLSLLLAVVCALIAYKAFDAHNTIAAVIAGIFALWFAVDAVRSFSWTRNNQGNQGK